MDDGVLESEPIDNPLENSESEMILSTPSKSLLIEDWFSESGMIHSIPQTGRNRSLNSVAFAVPKHFPYIRKCPLPTFRAHSIPQTGRNRSLNSAALGAPEHFTSIKKHGLSISTAIDIQQRLQGLIAGARQSWTYAIFWKAFTGNTKIKIIPAYVPRVPRILDGDTGYYGGEENKLRGTQSSKTVKDHPDVKKITDYLPRILDWGTGYYEGEEDKMSETQSSKTEKDHRKRSLSDLSPGLEMNNLNRYFLDPKADLEMNDLKRFFLMSKADIFFPGNGLPGRALCTSTAIWVSGAQKLAGFYCKHANGARERGIQTLVCIPLANGVVELGSSALIFPEFEFDLLDRVRPLFNFRNNICIQEIGTDSAGSSSIPPPIIPRYESESSVGNRPMLQQGDLSSQRDKETQINSNSDSDGRYLEVFTQILRQA